jgi:hypothetical protein
MSFFSPRKYKTYRLFYIFWILSVIEIQLRDKDTKDIFLKEEWYKTIQQGKGNPWMKELMQ